MKVYWLEQTEADVPAQNDWLSANETVSLNAMRFAKRRADWRLGRWTAKCALSAYLTVLTGLRGLQEIEICAAPDGAPEAFVGGQPAEVTISLSHRSGIAICAVAPRGVYIGCDVELVEPRSLAFVADYFTAKEQVRVARESTKNRDRLVTLLWSAKESALKALRAGLRLDTRSVIVAPCVPSYDRNGWSPLSVRYVGHDLPRNDLPKNGSPGNSLGEDRYNEGLYFGGHVFHGWWQEAHDMVRTLVAAPPPDSPILLRLPDHALDRPWKFESKFA
jgi:4'-phosphopantetheinyl transferase